MPLDGWDHVELFVGNAKQAAYWYEHAFGFRRAAYAGPETGVRDRASYVLEQGDIRLVVTSAVIYFDNASSGAACASSIGAPAGRNANVTVSSGDVKLNREFDVTASGATTILVDFNGDQSITLQGNGEYRMSPVIAVVSVS